MELPDFKRLIACKDSVCVCIYIHAYSYIEISTISLVCIVRHGGMEFSYWQNYWVHLESQSNYFLPFLGSVYIDTFSTIFRDLTLSCS